MKSPVRYVFLASIAFVVFACSLLWAQSYQGGVRGLVTDKQGAALPGAQVALTNEATKITRTSVTNAEGQYVFTAVEPAAYSIVITAAGFARLQQSSVVVGAQQFLTLDFQLEVGAVNQSVEVTATTTPLIDVSDASNGQVINTQMLRDLPPVARNPYLFEKLDNNVVATSAITGASTFKDQTGVSKVSIAGGPVGTNNYLIDGVPITDLNNRSVIVPSLEATKEVSLQANTYDAEIGRTGGGTFNTVLKSGTNALHGTLFGQTRQTNWAALPFFFPPGSPYNVDYYNYAGAIGGPVTIPHIYNGKDKTFFYVTEEGFRQRTVQALQFYVPTALERTGDFSQSSVKIYNPFAPLVSCPAPFKPTQMCRQPFPNNKIPANLINPVGQAIADVFPEPNQPVTSYGQTDFAQAASALIRADEFVGKVDHQFSSRWYSNFAYMHYGSTEPSPNPLGVFPGATAQNNSAHTLFRKVDAISQNNTFTLSPTSILTVGYGFNRFPNNDLGFSNGYSQTNLGLPASYVNSLQKAAFPALAMQTAASLGGSNAGPSVFYSRSFVAALAKSLGSHSLKVGFDFRTLSVDFTDTTSGNGTYAFANTFSEELPNTGGTSSGADIADLLLGTPTSGSVTTTSRLRLNVHYYGAYAQDNFRPTSRITLNLGLRYEYELGISERDNQFAVGFDPNVINPITSMSGIATKGGIEFAGQNNYPTHCCDASHTMFSPRLGIAFAVLPKTTVRAGYGVFYAPAFYTANASVSPGYTQTNTYVASNDGNVTPASSLSNPFPMGLQQPSGNSLGYFTGLGSSLTVNDQARRSPFVEQYSFDVQQELPSRMALKIGYVGAKGRNLLSSTTGGGALNINQLPDQYLSLGPQLLGKVANPYFNHGGTGVIGSPTVADNQLLRPFPEFASVNIVSGTAKSLYNALNVKLQKDMLHGISLLASYTWSSNWDSAWGTNNNLNGNLNGSPQDAYNVNAEYSRALDDIPHRFAVGSSVQLPFGRGKSFFSSNRILDSVVGGWTANVVGSIQTGSPLEVIQNTNNNASLGAGLQRPNLVGSPCYSGSPESRINNYLNAAAFAAAPIFTFGNTPRTIRCLGPGLDNWDLALTKDVHLEKATLQFRAEALNALNTPQFFAPVTRFGAATFGQIQTQANFPRFIELGGRIEF